MKLLIGGDSELGATTYIYLRDRGDAVAATTRRVESTSIQRPYFDFGSIGAFEVPSGARAACIFAGVTQPADCEADPIASARFNVEQTIELIERLVAQGLYVLFLSSNRVFDGAIPFARVDTPESPICEYGRQKAQVEAFMLPLLRRGAPLAILRLTKAVSLKTPLLVDWIRTLARGRPITAFHDIVVAPLSINAVSLVIAELLREEARGVFQFSGPEDQPYTSIARYIALKLGADTTLIHPATSLGANLPKGSVRRHTTLDSASIRDLCGIVALDAWTIIDRIVAVA